MNVTIRDMESSDIPMLVDYWFGSPESYFEALGVDFSKMPPKSDFRSAMEQKCTDNTKAESPNISALIIDVDGKSVGFHALNPLEVGNEGIFHAHIWDPVFRGKGVGVRSYPLACETFMKRFDLKRIVFKTPKQNVGAIRVKEKLGIRKTGEEEIGFGIIKEGTAAWVFELRADELRELKEKT